MPTIAQKLFDLGLKQTTWQNQQTGAEEHGTFKPDFNEPADRYGNPAGLAVKDWPARNKVGPHAAGDMALVTVDIARKVLGADTADERHDLADLDFVEGAGAHVLALAKASGDIVPQAPGSGTVPGPGPSTPPPLQSSTDRQLLELCLVGINAIEAAIAHPLTPIRAVDAAEGRALAALRAIKADALEYQAGLGDRPAEGRRQFVVGILKRAAEGGA